MNTAAWLRKRISQSGQRLAWTVFYSLYIRHQPQSTDQPGAEPPPEAATEERGGSISQTLASRGGNLNLVTRAEADSLLAAYSFRFVAMPLVCFFNSMRDTGAMSLNELASRLADDDKYRKEAIESFFQRAAEGVKSEGTEYLREELFHHKHLRNTSLWVFSQGFAMLLRFAIAYICFRRARAQHWQQLLASADYRDITRFMFNVCFTAAYLKGLSMPVIEGYAHFRELMESPQQVTRFRKAYGARASNAAQAFIDLQRLFVSAYGAEEAASLVEHIAKQVMNLPLAHKGIFDDFSFANVRQRKQTYAEALLLDPYIRLLYVKNVLANKVPSDPLECHRCITATITVGDFEKQFSAGLWWYFTRTFVPDQLVWFLLTRLLLSKYGVGVLSRLVWDIIIGGGKQVEHHAYSGLPGLRMYIPDGRVINYDPALEFFRSEGPALILMPGANATGVSSFEFGIRGFSDQMYQFIQLQALIMNTIVAKFFNWLPDDCEAYRRFMFQWIPSLEMHSTEVEEWLDNLNGRCQKIVEPLRAKLGKDCDPLVGETFEEFITAYEALFWESWNSLSDERFAKVKRLILLLGDGLYMHGLS